ncbi:15404_t:CDS:2 [Rhizophagus irregularis]|nr:15404_t:CDS:2 [Rhizophagus irregularis]
MIYRGNGDHFLVFLAIVTGLGQFIGNWLDVVLPPPPSLLPEARVNDIAVQHHEENDIGRYDLAQDKDYYFLYYSSLVVQFLALSRPMLFAVQMLAGLERRIYGLLVYELG